MRASDVRVHSRTVCKNVQVCGFYASEWRRRRECEQDGQKKKVKRRNAIARKTLEK